MIGRENIRLICIIILIKVSWKGGSSTEKSVSVQGLLVNKMALGCISQLSISVPYNVRLRPRALACVPAPVSTFNKFYIDVDH